MGTSFSISGNIVDVVNERIFAGTLEIKNSKIASVKETDTIENQYIIPGLIDSHIHIESSMLIPSEFARAVVCHGTVATVSDPHEIANVLGIIGVDFMIQNGNKVPFKFYFGAPSCVPATSFESSGANLNALETERLLQRNEIKYLSEMMNFPGVLLKDKEVFAKINAAKENNKPIDGHAPGIMGPEIKKYIDAGISTDHECFTLEEALEKISHGMKIQIREGSAAKNFDALIPLIKTHPENIMLCSDDKHPDELVKGHINLIVKRAVEKGYDPLKVLKVCTYNPSKHYNLDAGLLQKDDPADFVIIDNLSQFNIISTWIDGTKVYGDGKCMIKPVPETALNIFKANPISIKDLAVPAKGKKMNVIKALDGQLITKKVLVNAKVEAGNVVCDTDDDILKLVVLNRYKDSVPAIGFVKGFGLTKGAIASTVAHDSHNIIAVGTNDKDIKRAINRLIDSKGGISLADKDLQLHLPLPFAGIMSGISATKVALKYDRLDTAAKELGSNLKSPYMSLSFMALLVIPELKLSDKGLFDGTKFEFTELFDN